MTTLSSSRNQFRAEVPLRTASSRVRVVEGPEEALLVAVVELQLEAEVLVRSPPVVAEAPVTVVIQITKATRTTTRTETDL